MKAVDGFDGGGVALHTGVRGEVRGDADVDGQEIEWKRRAAVVEAEQLVVGLERGGRRVHEGGASEGAEAAEIDVAV
jgi:hypothetical protein